MFNSSDLFFIHPSERYEPIRLHFKKFQTSLYKKTRQK